LRQKSSYDVETLLEFRRVLFRSRALRVAVERPQRGRVLAGDVRRRLGGHVLLVVGQGVREQLGLDDLLLAADADRDLDEVAGLELGITSCRGRRKDEWHRGE